MRNTNTDRKWIGLIALLLIAEVLWLLVDLQWIDVPFFFKKSQSSQMSEAGYIISSKKDLKRRGANSLIWEDTQAKDTLFYHDSVLTLSQSSAKLYLRDQTDLELSENTLVTLEEPEDKTKSEIRLRFSRGDLRARNPSFNTSVVGEDWVINLDKGSDIMLRKDQGSYEFEVVSGAATLHTQNGDESLTQDKILKLNDDHKVEKVEKSTELQWKEKKPIRIYTLEENAKIPLEWSGDARGLVINKAGSDEKNQTISDSKQTSQVQLTQGSYKIRLKNASGLSEARTVEVWKAPHIYLKKPLPRDRLKTNEPYEFIWTTDKGIKTYRVQFSSKASPLKQESADQNFTTMKFDQEQDLKWQVQGEDEEGFLIPALYNNEIYLRDEPLQAPKLKLPDVKKAPASTPGASYKSKWHWIYAAVFSEAFAKNDNYEINFAWESVTGADQYILEVSSTPDFRDPELIKNLTQTSYIWKNVKYKKYFWRVAAGSAKGRMGLFSEPMELQLDEIKVIEAPIAPAQAEAEPVPAPTVMPEAITAITKIEPVAEPTNITITLPEIPSGWGLALAPSMKYSKTKGEKETQIDLQGPVPMGFQISFNSGWIDQRNYRFNFWTSQQTWKPMPVTEFPFQDNLKIRESILTFDRGHINEKNRFGFILHENFISKRQTQESLTVQSEILLGLRTSRLFNPNENWQNTLGLSLLTSGKVHELMFDGQSKLYLSNRESKFKWSIGLGANANYQKQKSGGGLQSDLIFLLGLERF
ncbi:hypothetical protein CIK05_01445 [Bdellovibrio sp. qaytius]|nr:hypothetical protein CIK05_01445 [Bdellovibrio sp. qaytius]